MFNYMINNFDIQMMQNRLLQNFQNPSSSFSFWFEDEYEQEEHPYYTLNGIQTRIVWVTNYITNEDFPIHVPANDSVVHHLDNTIEQKTLLSNEMDDTSFLNQLHTFDLSKLNLDDLLLLLYRLQQKTTKNSITIPSSPISSSSSSSSNFIEHKSSFRSPTYSHTVPSSISIIDHIPSLSRRQSSFTLSNLADVPKKLTTTLSKPICSYHLPTSKHIHSPNDVVDKLVQSFNLQHKSPSYTYQESQQHKAKLISNLLRKSSYTNKSYH